jgi:MFS family permease
MAASEDRITNDTVTSPVVGAGVGHWAAFAVLMAALMFAFVDRQVLLLASEPIRLSLGLSDLQLGLLQGTGVALVAGLVTFPLGWLADRYDRRWVLAACVAVWSFSVFASSLVQTFEGLMLFTALAGAGEAGLTPIFYTVVPLLFFGKDRQMANALIAIVATGGGALALLIASEVFDVAELWAGVIPYRGAEVWRAGFAITSVAAIVLIPLILLTSLLGSRSAHLSVQPAGTADHAEATALESLSAFVRRHWSLLLRFVLAGALGSFAFVSISVWVAIIAARTFGQSPSEAGGTLGSVLLTATGLAFVLNWAFTRWLYDRKGERLLLMGISISFLVGTSIIIVLPFVGTMVMLYVVYGAIMTCTAFASMSYPTALQSLSPAHLRGRITAINFLASMLFASASPPLVGLVSDQVYGAASAQLTTALALVAGPAALLATLLYYSCLRRGFMETLADVSAQIGWSGHEAQGQRVTVSQDAFPGT